MQMLKLLKKLIHSTAFKIIVQFLASLASAIVVISGFLVFLNLTKRNKDENVKEVEGVVKDQENKQATVDASDES
jgi:hypothetical protein